MDPLVLVTLVSLGIALAMTIVALRLLREERRRSEARITALTANLAAPDETAGAAVGPGSDPVARAEAHVVDSQPLPVRPTARPVEAVAAGPANPRSVPPVAADVDTLQPMFAAVTHSATRALPWPLLAVGAALLVVASLFGFSRAAAGDGEAAGRAAAPVAPAPLELVSLRHARQGSTWTITGLVRNAPAGPAVERVAAIAFFFDRTGSFLGSGRSPLEFPSLAAGEEAPFVVETDVAGDVGRYRLSFRDGDGRVVRHIDRRAGEGDRKDRQP